MEKRMDLKQFKATLETETPPTGLSTALKALWREAKGDWDAAHDLLQEENDRTGAWVHAYLHRREGDNANAAYWYARAGRTLPQQTLEAEWEEIVEALLSGQA
jgi:hypothetical protein